MVPRNMEHNFSIKKKVKENIDITVNLKTSLTVSLRIKIVEDMLKYILYQRQQIPVHFDVLAREAANASHQDSNQDPQCDPQWDPKREPQHGPQQDPQWDPKRDPQWDPQRDPSQDPHTQVANKIYTLGNQDGFNNQVYSRKKEVARRTLNRKRERWLAKVKNFIANFKRVMQILRTEFEGGDVLAVNLILGSSVMSSREVFSIVFPRDCDSSAAEFNISNGRNTVIELLRALVENEDLVKLVNRPISVQKVWVMVQKSHSLNQTLLPPLHSNSCDLVLHLGYSPNLRAKVVQINVCHPSAVTPMDLTPCVGRGIAEYNGTSIKKNGTKRSLGFSVPSVSKRYSSANDTSNYSKSQSTSDSSPIDENTLKMTSREERANLRALNCIKANDLIDKNLSNQRSKSFKPVFEMPINPVLEMPIKSVLETPLNTLSRIESITETPTSQPTPSKLLTTQLGKFTLSERCMDDAVCNSDDLQWYQIDQTICGFKDVCFL